ncbi:Alginate lyase [Mariniphaga anaerophila]|uniref:Alginate lyase n=1 Tax=Mariniphaga anaerophila TaxID=1484053 RepID=A0A1M4ZRM7_9BACT|nr:alginate lyase family protein [Mariniphaga anaerophila]SHF20565.1 Alginate lyase [Mariniphaga anaerophila]
MKLKALLFLLVVTICLSGCTGGKDKVPQDVKLGSWDYSWMQQVKKGLEDGNPDYSAALDLLILDADQAMRDGVYSVTFKDLVPPGGSKHDYMSMGPYWWPNPDTPDGLPYIRRDGEVNPEGAKLDRTQLGKLTNAMRSLSIAWFFTDKKEYAEKAAELLRVWFLDPETLMNPHLNYGQSIPGITDGRFIGIIDGYSFVTLVDAIALIEASGALSAHEKTGLKNWFEEYFIWLSEGEFGKQEEDYKNNHSVAFDVQSSAIAYFLGKNDYIRKKAEEIPHRRIDPMIEADGRQPEELIRTRAYGYSVGNLRNFFNAGRFAQTVGVDIFDYVNPKGGSLQKALDYLVGFIGHEEDWPYEEISSWENFENNLGLLVRRAVCIYKDEAYLDLWKNTFQKRMESDWRLLVEPECDVD